MLKEDNWLKSNDLIMLLVQAQYLKRFSNRKKRLLGCAFCRRAWHFITEPRWQEVVDVLERFSDQRAARVDVGAAVEEAMKMEGRWGNSTSCRIVWSLTRTTYFAKWGNIHGTALNVQCAIRDRAPEDRAIEAMSTEQGPQCELIREIVGNPHRELTVEKHWLTADVKALARAAYEERSLPAGALDSVRLAILADALQDAGCDSDDVLNHLRDATAPHVRGCWALDLLLGKK